MKWVGGLAVLVAAGAFAVLVLRSDADGGQSADTTASASSDAGDVQRPPARRLSRVVAGVRFSFEVPRCCWETGPHQHLPNLEFRNGRLFVSESSRGPQGAEAVFFWTSFPDGARAEPCATLLRRPVGPSTADLVSAAARTPGIELADGPVKLAVGGRPATYVMLEVFLDLGCDPGFFFTWEPRGRRGECWGACWLESSVGDTISIWVVEVGGKRLVFEGVTTDQASPEAAHEIRQMVESIRFHS